MRVSSESAAKKGAIPELIREVGSITPSVLLVTRRIFYNIGVCSLKWVTNCPVPPPCIRPVPRLLVYEIRI